MFVSVAVENILADIREAGGKPFLVGGFVRDHVLGVPSKDIDIEVYALAPNSLLGVLEKHGQVKFVGESFGVFLLTLPNGDKIDVSSPRKDNKRGEGHRGFDVDVDPFLPLEEAVARRDFTMNAMLLDPATGAILDPLGGQEDLSRRLLRACGPTFEEDPLRVLRGMQFAARFGLTAAPNSLIFSRRIRDTFFTLSEERIWGEWEKFFKGNYPIKGLEFLRDSGWITLYPELNRLIGTEQEPAHHPEGDVYVHTGLVMTAMAQIAKRDSLSGTERTIAMAAALLHDIGKPLVTERVEGKIQAHGHDKAGVAPALRVLSNMNAPEKVIQPVLKLVEEHMAHIHTEPTPRVVRRLANRLHPHATIVQWERLVEADHSGRHPLPKGRPAREWLTVAESVHVTTEQPKPIIGGAMLIARGMKPGPHFRPILDAAFSAQLDGEVTADNAAEWLETYLKEQS